MLDDAVNLTSILISISGQERTNIPSYEGEYFTPSFGVPRPEKRFETPRYYNQQPSNYGYGNYGYGYQNQNQSKRNFNKYSRGAPKVKIRLSTVSLSNE